MRRTRRRAAIFVSFTVATLVAGPSRAQQEVGHRILGTLGLQAGSQAPTGLYLVDQFAYYHSNEIVDRSGRALPVGLDVDLLVNGLAAGVSLELPRIATFVNASVS